MNRKLEPQIAPSASMPGSHLVNARLETLLVGDVPVGAAGVAVTGDTVPVVASIPGVLFLPSAGLVGLAANSSTMRCQCAQAR
jgi:hypothetical protein